MKLYLRATLVTIFVAILFTLLFWRWREATKPVKSEQRAAQMDLMETQGLYDFEAKRLDGTLFRLKELKGRVVIVSFWASWCGPCLEEFPSMIELVEKSAGKVQLIAVSQDSEMEEINSFLKAFPKSKNPNIHILWDEDHSIGKLYNADRLPESYVADKEHKLVRKIVGSINWATPEAIEFMRNIAEK